MITYVTFTLKKNEAGKIRICVGVSWKILLFQDWLHCAQTIEHRECCLPIEVAVSSELRVAYSKLLEK